MLWHSTTYVLAVASREWVITVAWCLMAVALTVATAVSLATPDSRCR